MKHEELIKVWDYTYIRPDGVVSYCNKEAIEHMITCRTKSKLPILEHYEKQARSNTGSMG